MLEDNPAKKLSAILLLPALGRIGIMMMASVKHIVMKHCNRATCANDTQLGGAILMLTLCNYCRHCLAELFHDETGQTAYEYVMLLVLLAVAAFVTCFCLTAERSLALLTESARADANLIVRQKDRY